MVTRARPGRRGRRRAPRISLGSAPPPRRPARPAGRRAWWPHGGPAPARSRARRPSRARSRRPIAQRGPASRVSRAALAVTSWIRVSVATTSATSGRRSSPFRPTISTGTSCAESASNDRGRVGVVAHQDADLPSSTAPRCGRPGRRGSRSPPSPARSSSSSQVSCTIARTSPGSAPGLGSSGRSSGRSAYSPAARWLAEARIRSSERRLTVSG